MTKTLLLGSQFAATVLKYYTHKYICKSRDEVLLVNVDCDTDTKNLQQLLYDILLRLQRKVLIQKMKNNPSTIKNAKCVQSYELPIWQGQTKLLTDLTIKVKHGGYLHSDQARGSRREKSEIHQCWAGKNKNVIFIVKNNLKKPNKQ